MKPSPPELANKAGKAVQQGIRIKNKSRSNWAQIRPLHFNHLANLQQPRPHRGRIKPCALAHHVEIRFLFEDEFLRFAPRSQRAVAPIFHRHHDHRRPQPPFRDTFFRHRFLNLRSSAAPPRFSYHLAPRSVCAAPFAVAVLPLRMHLTGQSGRRQIAAWKTTDRLQMEAFARLTYHRDYPARPCDSQNEAQPRTSVSSMNTSPPTESG